MTITELVRTNFGFIQTVKEPVLFQKRDRGWILIPHPSRKQLEKYRGAYYVDGLPREFNTVGTITNNILFKSLLVHNKEVEKFIRNLAKPKKKV